MFNDIMKEKFGDYHEIGSSPILDDEDNSYSGNTLIQIIHNNLWKDVWINEDEICSIVVVYPECMGGRELNKWKTLCEKGIVN